MKPMTPASKHLAHIRAVRLEAPAQRKGLDAETFRGFQLAEELFLLTSFFIDSSEKIVGYLGLRQLSK
jgi:hypothetical protein